MINFRPPNKKRKPDPEKTTHGLHVRIKALEADNRKLLKQFNCMMSDVNWLLSKASCTIIDEPEDDGFTRSLHPDSAPNGLAWNRKRS